MTMIVSWMTTNRCNLRCKHCHQDAAKCDSRELTTAEDKKMIEEITLAGFKIMIFSGGEVLMRDDFYELVTYVVLGRLGMLRSHEPDAPAQGRAQKDHRHRAA